MNNTLLTYFKKIIYVVVLLLVSSFLAPVTTFAAVLTDHMDASYVIGQPDFTTTNTPASQTTLKDPVDVAVDATHHRLFVAEGPYVLVFDTSGGITNGMAASFILGDATFSNIETADINHFRANAVAYDPNHNLLFVADAGHHRVLVFDVATITDGEPAINVLGQDNFTGYLQNKDGNNAVTASGLKVPEYLVYDAARNYLFVSEDNNRITVFDLSLGITDGMDASFVIGQPDLVSGPSSSGLNDAGLNYPRGMVYDSVRHLLYVGDDVNKRVLVFDIETITNGESAIHVLGNTNFTSAGPGATTQSTFQGTEGLALDEINQRLFISDKESNRVLVFNVSTITDGEDAVNVLGQPDFTTSTGNSSGVFTPGGKGGTYAPCSNCIAFAKGLAYSSSNHFLYQVDGANHRLLAYDLSAQAEIAYSGSFTESDSDDGSVTGSRIATLTNDTFVNGGGTLTEGVHYTLTNKPSGLTAVMSVSGDGTTATLTLTGNATSHANANDISNLTITFLDGAFTGNLTASQVTNYVNTTGVIDFISVTPTTTISAPSSPIGIVSGGRAYTPPAPQSSPYSFVRTLKRGMVGDDVKTIQLYLKQKADGKFGLKTKKAVQEFQKAHGLHVDGSVGPKTRALMQ